LTASINFRLFFRAAADLQHQNKKFHAVYNLLLQYKLICFYIYNNYYLYLYFNQNLHVFSYDFRRFSYIFMLTLLIMIFGLLFLSSNLHTENENKFRKQKLSNLHVKLQTLAPWKNCKFKNKCLTYWWQIASATVPLNAPYVNYTDAHGQVQWTLFSFYFILRITILFYFYFYSPNHTNNNLMMSVKSK
jgi:hypothetical protein